MSRYPDCGLTTHRQGPYGTEAASRERYQLDGETAPPKLINHAEFLQDTLRSRELKETRDSAVRELSGGHGHCVKQSVAVTVARIVAAVIRPAAG
jgi:hypothetical protein